MTGRYEKALDAAVADGVLSRTQADEVRRRAESKEDRSARTVRLVSWIGSTLVAVGIIIFVATNWQDLPDGFRTFLLAGTAVFFAGLGWRLLEHGHIPTGHGALVVSGAAIGGTIFQIANWVNLPPDNPMLLAVWFLSLLPIAYAFRSPAVLVEAILVLPFWLGFTLFDGNDTTYHTAILLFGTTALALASAAYLHDNRLPGFRPVLLATGVVGTLLVGFVATFAAGNTGEFDMRWTGPAILWLIGALLVVGAGTARRASLAEPQWDLALLGILAGVVLVAGFGADRPLVNILYAVLLVGLILVAVQSRSELVINIGLAWFVVEVVGRYFDFLIVEDLNPAFFFIGGGILLLASGYAAERLRRRLRPPARHEVSDG